MGAPTETGRVIAGRYRLIEALGSGGMGTVWLADDELLHRQVAVKEVFPPPGVSDNERAMLRERTLREARTAARLSHPNVITIYDVVEDADQPWIVMELLAARSLREIVAGEGPLTPAHAARVGLQLLAALRAAHALGIMHRDVKPGNVLIDADGRAVLADFGIARVQDSPATTASGVLVGSPSYIAPERARGERGGPESDLWSLGATIYAAVEGRPPYDRAGALPTLMAVVAEEPDPPRRAGPLWPVISGLLASDPGRRLGSAAAERMLRRVAEAGEAPATAPLPVADAAAGPGPAGRLERAERTRAFPVAATMPSPPAESPAPAAASASRAEPEGDTTPTPTAGLPVAPVVPVVPVVAAVAGRAATPAAAPTGPGEPGPGPGGGRVAEPVGSQPEAPAEAAPAELDARGPQAHEPEPEPEPPDETRQAEAEPEAPELAASAAAGPIGPALPEPGPADRAGRRAGPASGDRPPGPSRRPRRGLVAAAAALAIAAGLAIGLYATHGPAAGTTAARSPARPGHATSARGARNTVTPATPDTPAPASSGSRASATPPPSAAAATPEPTTAGPVARGPVARGPVAAPAGYRTYQDPTGFSIALPDGWAVSHQGGYTYLPSPSGGDYLLIDQSSHPKPDPLADWQQQEANRIGTYPGYHRIRLEAIHYPQAEKAADWEFTYYRQGVLVHVLNRNILANATHAYALYWSTPQSEWARDFAIFTVLARTFRPART